MDQRLIGLGLIIVLVAALFGSFLWLQRRIEPNDRDTDNDEWLKKGPD